MPFDSLGEFIKAADAVGEVQFIEGADLELDVGGLTELTAERSGPMLVFDKFAGYPAGHRVCANANRTLRRFALAMDLPKSDFRAVGVTPMPKSFTQSGGNVTQSNAVSYDGDGLPTQVVTTL